MRPWVLCEQCCDQHLGIIDIQLLGSHTDIEFIVICAQNAYGNILCIWLPYGNCKYSGLTGRRLPRTVYDPHTAAWLSGCVVSTWAACVCRDVADRQARAANRDSFATGAWASCMPFCMVTMQVSCTGLKWRCHISVDSGTYAWPRGQPSGLVLCKFPVIRGKANGRWERPWDNTSSVSAGFPGSR